MTERTKTFELQGSRFQVSKLTALDGSSLLRKFSGSGIQDPQEFLSKMPDVDFRSLQILLLSNISEIQVINGVEVMLPIILPSGVMEGKISEDASLVWMLTMISLMFNLSGFFVGSVLKDYQVAMESINTLRP